MEMTESLENLCTSVGTVFKLLMDASNEAKGLIPVSKRAFNNTFILLFVNFNSLQ